MEKLGVGLLESSIFNITVHLALNLVKLNYHQTRTIKCSIYNSVQLSSETECLTVHLGAKSFSLVSIRFPP